MVELARVFTGGSAQAVLVLLQVVATAGPLWPEHGRQHAGSSGWLVRPVVGGFHAQVIGVILVGQFAAV